MRIRGEVSLQEGSPLVNECLQVVPKLKGATDTHLSVTPPVRASFAPSQDNDALAHTLGGVWVSENWEVALYSWGELRNQEF
jgi:hypothetical protein